MIRNPSDTTNDVRVAELTEALFSPPRHGETIEAHGVRMAGVAQELERLKPGSCKALADTLAGLRASRAARLATKH